MFKSSLGSQGFKFFTFIISFIPRTLVFWTGIKIATNYDYKRVLICDIINYQLKIYWECEKLFWWLTLSRTNQDNITVLHIHPYWNLTIHSNNLHCLLLLGQNLCDIYKHHLVFDLMDNQPWLIFILKSANCRHRIMGHS